MSFKGVVTGNLGATPELRVTSSGVSVTNLSIAATHVQRDRDTKEWCNVGETLWIKAVFWENEAGKLASTLFKGDRVSVEGVLVNKPWERETGEENVSLELYNPRFLGVVPRESGQHGQKRVGVVENGAGQNLGEANSRVASFFPAEQGRQRPPF